MYVYKRMNKWSVVFVPGRRGCVERPAWRCSAHCSGVQPVYTYTSNSTLYSTSYDILHSKPYSTLCSTIYSTSCSTLHSTPYCKPYSSLHSTPYIHSLHPIEHSIVHSIVNQHSSALFTVLEYNQFIRIHPIVHSIVHHIVHFIVNPIVHLLYTI